MIGAKWYETVGIILFSALGSVGISAVCARNGWSDHAIVFTSAYAISSLGFDILRATRRHHR